MTNTFIHLRREWPAMLMLFSGLLLTGCKSEDPKPVNEEEVITTVEVTLVPDDGGATVTLKFFDEDGEFGSIAPVTTISGPLKAGATYAGAITLLNETLEPAESVSDEVAEEADAHLFCYTTTNVEVAYSDQDANGLPIGLLTTWTAGAAGNAEVEIVLRHQPGTKDGKCPGTGETDVQVTFPLQVVE